MGAQTLEDLGVRMRANSDKWRKWIGFGIGPLLVFGCASSFLKYEKSGDLNSIKEFDQQVKIDAPGEAEEKSPGTVAVASTPVPTLSGKKSKKQKKSKIPEAPVAPGAPVAVPVDQNKHEPELEGQNGFTGRRPTRDPFRPGERIVHEVSYFNVKAGELILSVKPMAQVNGHKNYHFSFGLKTSSLFSSFYSVDDEVSSLMDFDRMIPSVFTLHVKESGQLRESRFFIDWAKMQASFWEKKVTKKDGPEEKKMQWEVPEFSQDVFSSAFYMRVFPWVVGAEHAFRVTDNAENLIFRGKALRRETITTAAGTFQTIVIKPDIELRGQFKPVGDIFFWLTDDDRRFLVKIESKIKIGTIVSEVIEINRGRDEAP